MAITGKAIAKKNLSMPEAAEALTVTSVAVCDAFISSWDAKYYFGTIRPVTYINRHITPDWQPILQTPPFPEFPSAHSTISAAAATVLTSFFGDHFAFTDSTEAPFGLPVRSFDSFIGAALECANSRMYGGIHFAQSNRSGTATGMKIGEKVLSKLNNQ
ncbi:MAG TPA: vanadium-dependent haloperoxidase [Bacteroidia bacterium]|nr:vanadium-dependent haloperoxidase [Bacteroidia bacterium]